MLYRILADGNLFEAWKVLEKGTAVRLLSGLVQNDAFIPTSELNKEFEVLHSTLIKLREKYTESFITRIEALRDRTVAYINTLNNTPLSDDEFGTFRNHCEQHTLHHAEGSGEHIHVCAFQGSAFNKGICSKAKCPL